jgi:phosphate-selective porin OprO/OprP
MARPTKSALFRLFLVLVGAMAAPWCAPAAGQVPPALADSQQLLERLGKTEQPLDWLTRKDGALLPPTKLPTEKPEAPFPIISTLDPQGVTSGPSTPAPDAVGPSPFQTGGPPGMRGQPESPGGGSERRSVPTAGGGSRASGGGDPTSIGRAQEVGNRHLGKVGLNPYYLFQEFRQSYIPL